MVQMDVKLSNVSKRLAMAKALIFVLAMALALSLGFSLEKAAHGQTAQQNQLPSPMDLSRAFINVAKQVEPAVVNIDVVERSKQAVSPRMRRGTIPQIPGLPNFGDLGPQVQRGTGSGVIISPDGYILTNNHVAGDADEIKVKLGDGREFKATRVGTDSETDLAVIKINASGLPFARLGNSDAVQQGEWVVALGSPFGLQQTMTAGIISAVGRNLNRGSFDNYIQTDASINPGNSGGPLVNMNGEIIGINTLIYSESGTSAGVGFSIPSNLANKVYGSLVKYGKVTRGFLGVSLQSMDSAYAKQYGYDKKGGALIADVPDSHAPAARAGLQSGDVIVEFDGKPVASPRELTDLVAEEPVGKTVQVKYLRDGKLQTTSLKTAERPANGEVASNRNGEGEGDEEHSASKLGLSVKSVTPDDVQEYNLKMNTGAIVESVEPGSPAESARIQPGDVIHRVGMTRVTNAADLTRAIRSLGNQKEVVVQIESRGRLGFVTVSLE
jgi:serine protease Do